MTTTITWYSPSGTEVIFSEDSETYKLLLGMKGFSGNPPSADQITQAPFQDGATRSGTLYDPRELSFRVLVQGPTLRSMQQNAQYLSLAFGAHQGEGTLVYKREDGLKYAIPCIANGKTPGDPEEESPTHFKTTIRLIAYDPVWESYPKTRTDFAAGSPLQFPFKFPFKFPSSSPTHTVINAGNVATPIKLTITGAIVNPTITRTYLRTYTDPWGIAVTETVSEAISFTLTMTEGEILTITTGPGNPSLSLLHDDGNYDANPFQYLGANPKFFLLQPGENTVSLTSVSMDAATTMVSLHGSRFTAV